MEAKMDYVRARISHKDKMAAEAILEEIGLDHSQAIRMFYRSIIHNEGIPFEAKIPNKETIKAIEDARKGIGLTRYNSVDELFAEIDSYAKKNVKIKNARSRKNK